MENFEIYISYRRAGGAHLAGRVKSALEAIGFSVFKGDVPRGGKFDEAILRGIEEATDVIIILTQGSLDRCQNDDDWLRHEIRHAFKHNRNIVLVMDRDFQMPPPETIPVDIADLSRLQGIILTQDEFQIGLDKLVKAILKNSTDRHQ